MSGKNEKVQHSQICCNSLWQSFMCIALLSVPCHGFGTWASLGVRN